MSPLRLVPKNEGESKPAPRVPVTEALIGVALLAIVAAFVTPSLLGAAARSRADQVIKDLRQVSTAANQARTRSGEWPEDGAPGSAPSSLKPFLPQSVSFQRDRYQLCWDHWNLSRSPGDGAATSEFAAVSVTTDDPQLLGLVNHRLGSAQTHFTVGNRTFVMVSDPGIAAP